MTMFTPQPSPGRNANLPEVNLRKEAVKRLKEIESGHPVQPLTLNQARAMAQVGFSAQQDSLKESTQLFSLMLDHPDFPGEILAWVVNDASFQNPDLVIKLLQHPNCDIHVLLSAARKLLWSFRGALTYEEWLQSHPVATAFADATPQSATATKLVASWGGYDFSVYSSTLVQILSSQTVEDVFWTLVHDQRPTLKTSSYRLPEITLKQAANQAYVVVNK